MTSQPAGTTPQQVGPPPPEEGELVTVDHDGSAVAVTMLDGELHAFDDTCPHAGCSLADGELDGRTVVCPCHLARFDVTTGDVVDGPAASGVALWSAKVTDGALQIEPAEGGGGTPAEPPPSSGDQAAGPSSAPDLDITVLIEREHGAIRRQFEAIEPGSDLRELDRAWTALAELLEVHASGEETLLYPKLARAADDGVEEAVHAVRDHNEIRDSVRAVGSHDVGSEGWWQAFRTAREVNEEHLQEEERDALPSFRDSTDKSRREDLGRQWVEYHEEHVGAQGLSGDDADPDDVIADPGPAPSTS